MKRRVNVRGLIINDNGQLFCQRLKVREQDGRDFWCTPGGGLEIGESLHDGLRREMIEETGIAPQIGHLAMMQQFAEKGDQSAHGPHEQLEFFFYITNWQDYESINLAATSHGEAEVSECGFVDPKTAVILPTILTEIDLTKLTNAESPVLIKSEL